MRKFEGWNEKEINRLLPLVGILMAKHKKTNDQIKEFVNITNKSRATFFRYKSFLNNKTDKMGINVKENKYCYFCNSNKNIIIHHKDKNRENNQPNNLLKLCASCHSKLHYLQSHGLTNSRYEY